MNDVLRALPSVDALVMGRLRALPRAAAVAAARQVLDEARAAVRAGGALPEDVEALALERARLLAHGRVRRVINATGVVLHTNLGRASWPSAAREAAARAMGACSVELDLASGRRGGRLDAIRYQLRALCGAEDALVVNNCAAAVLLALTAVAAGREVIVSRGELVEIGGSFRVPEVIASGGASLVEVGTTNRTRADDYRRAIGPQTGALLRVHASNFRIIGFTERPARRDLVRVAHEADLPLLEDLGGGAWRDHDGEPGVCDALRDGADLVLFSGDKLLGGPQAGLIVGAHRWVDRLARHPLYRALRVDKVTLAALEATLGCHLGAGPLPVDQQLGADLGERTAAFVERLRAAGVAAEVRASDGFTGAGAQPGRPIASVAAVLPGLGERHARALRLGEPAVVARLADGALWVDLRAVERDADALLVAALTRVAGEPGSSR